MTFDDIAPNVLPKLPGIGVPRLRHELLRAAQHVCRTARVWRIWTDATEVQAAGEYDYELPTDSQIEVVEALTVDGRYRTPTPWTLAPGAPEDLPLHKVVPGRLVFELSKDLPAPRQVRWRLSLAPTEKATSLPDDIFLPWAALLSDGVLARCMSDVGRPWSSGDAAAYLKLFEEGCDMARKRTWHGYTDVVPRQRVQWC